MGNILELVVPGIGLLAVIVWGYVLLRAWIPAARQRGGFWYLEAVVILAIPVMTLLTALDREPSLTKPAAMGAQAVSALVVVLSAWALLRAVAVPRKDVGWLMFAVVFFYIALLLSAAFGVIPSLPPSYLITPLVVLAFLCHGDYTYHWLLKTALVALRVTMVLSFAAIWFMPETAFNTEESRTFFGLNRLAGIAGHPNGLAALAAIGLLLEVRSRSRKIWMLLFVAAILVAQSSTGYFVVLSGLLIMGLYTRPILRWVVGVGLASLFACLSFFPATAGAVAAALGLDDSTTFNGRGRIWAAALKGFDRNPVFGYGPELLGERYRQAYLPGFDAATHAHNQFIQTLASTGVIGGLSLALLVVTVTILAFRARHRMGGLGLALVAFIALRSATETPLKPGGVGFGTATIVIVVSLIGAAWSERADATPDEAADAATAPLPVVPSPRMWGNQIR